LAAARLTREPRRWNFARRSGTNSGRPRGIARAISHERKTTDSQSEEVPMKWKLPAAVTALAVAALSMSAVTRGAEQGMQEHMHHGSGAAVAQMTLDAGKKWATDEPLRAGMAAIGKAFDADHPAIHAGTETDAQYDALAATIEREVNTIVANCHLPPAADANLHYVIADLMQGVNLMRGKATDKSRHDGAALVHGALVAYGRHFDDPAAAAEDHMPK